ncbi:MAG: 30S ribosomal protein S20 [Patescibacteria group bacterium]|nr:30S ribosomal protein S20 [Patescibacteria group bacterium]
MANKQSALKEIRKTIKRTEHNSRVKTNFKHLFRACADLIQAGDKEGAKAKAVEFQKAADKAAQRHIISKNRVNRKKAALAALLNGKREIHMIKGKAQIQAVQKEKPVETKEETTQE